MDFMIQGNAINYSGYRDGQSPHLNEFPTKDEILEDLKLLEGSFKNLRIYDCTLHAYRVLEVIQEQQLNFKVMLGLALYAEENHVGHPYYHQYSEEEFIANKRKNEELVQEIIGLANTYREIVNAVSIGNEIRSIWSNNRVPIERMIEVTKTIQNSIVQPVTYCEEYHKWIEELKALGETVDFVSIHTYPAWQGSGIETALQIATDNYLEVKAAYPDKMIAITETGWPTSSHGHRIKIENANIANQLIYNEQISDWGKQNNVPIYLFEAFDENWKGENNPKEPEKNWGIFDANRKRKGQ